MQPSLDVLVVDDRAIDAEMTLHIVRRLRPGARTLWLSAGDEALEYLFAVGAFAGWQPPKPSLAIIDDEMPTVSGSAMVDLIRMHPLMGNLPVILLTDRNPVRSRAGMRFAAHEYIIKSVDFDDYCSVLGHVLERWLPPAVPRAVRSAV
jgi:two-component system, response regulator